MKEREQIIGRPFQILDEDNIGYYMVWGYARRAVQSGEYDKLVNLATWEYYAGLPRPLWFLYRLPLINKSRRFIGILVQDPDDKINENQITQFTIRDERDKLSKCEEFEIIASIDDDMRSKPLFPSDRLPGAAHLKNLTDKIRNDERCVDTV